MDYEEVAWLAGLLEGEGCFCVRTLHNPIIQLVMTDMDVVIKAAKTMGAYKVVRQKRITKGGKMIYRTVLYGAKAIEIMRIIRPHMGERRKGQIDMCITSFETKNRKPYKQRTPYSRGAEIVWEGGGLT